MILRCTKRLLDVLGHDRLASVSPEPDAEDWYANLVWIERRKCLLLTHAAAGVCHMGAHALGAAAYAAKAAGLAVPDRADAIAEEVPGNLATRPLRSEPL